MPASTRELRRLYREVRREAETLTGDLGAEALAWRPAAGKWSIAEHLGHLDETGRLYAERLESCFDRAERRGLSGDGTLRFGPFERLFLRELSPPPRRRIKAPGIFLPSGGRAPAETLAAFLTQHARFDALVRRAAGLPIDRLRIPTPVSRFLRLRAGAALTVIPEHARRHLWHCRRVREEPAFPGGPAGETPERTE